MFWQNLPFLLATLPAWTINQSKVLLKTWNSQKITHRKKNLSQSRARFSSFTHTHCSASARYKIWNITNASAAAYLRAEPAIIGVATPSHAPRARREAPAAAAADMRTTTAKTTALTHGLLLVCILLCCDDRRRDGAHWSLLTKPLLTAIDWCVFWFRWVAMSF